MDSTLSQAIVKFQAGDIFEAHRLCKGVVEGDTTSSVALHFFGVLEALHKNTDSALRFFDRALIVDPQNADIFADKGKVLSELNQHQDAYLCFERALSINPQHLNALHNQGCSLLALGRPADALNSFDRLLKIANNYPSALNNRGVALKQLKRYEEAVANFKQAILLTPQDVEVLSNLADSLFNLQNYSDSIAAYDKALAIKPDMAEAWLGRGNVLCELRRYDEALVAYDKALTVKPDMAEAWLGRGNLYCDLKRYDEAFACCDKAIALKPDCAEAYSNRGNAFKDLARFNEAVASYDRAVALNPDLAEAYWNKSLVLLLCGEFDRGLELFEWRWKTRNLNSPIREFNSPLWLGDEDISGKKILIHSEQGLGDTIQFCRFAGALINRGAQVLLAPQKTLMALMKNMDVNCEVVDVEDRTIKFDFRCPLSSLPLALKMTSENIPCTTPYLHAEPERVRQWADRLGEAGFKIGICWQGSTGRIDAGRSFPITEFIGVSKIPKVRLISLHKGEGTGQLEHLGDSMRVETLGDEFDSGPDAFLDTAAVMKLCDLVITSDTAVAHLAGALGLPTWVVLKKVPDWRWMLDRSDSPWYPTVRLFRQTVSDDWKGVFIEIENELRALLNVN